jgi:hypothetical protein
MTINAAETFRMLLVLSISTEAEVQTNHGRRGKACGWLIANSKRPRVEDAHSSCRSLNDANGATQ